MLKRNDPCWCGSGKKYKRCHLHEDEKSNRKTPRLPGRMVKTSEELEGMRRAGEFNGQLMDYIRPYVKAGVSTADIDRLVYDYTLEHGHQPACLGYHGYPKSACVSINNVVCHGIPSPEDIIREGDIVNVDLTTIVDGFHGDSSETFIIGEAPDATRRLVEVTARALLLGIEAAVPGKPLQAVAQAIQPYVESQGCSVVQQYTGHGIGRKFHEHFSVYHHVARDAEAIMLEPGMTFTIEPMVNAGAYKVVTDPDDGWTVRTKDGSLSAQFEHTIAITDTGCEVLTRTPSQKAENAVLLVKGMTL